ncbi:ABC transporter substrate-binding protein [Desertibaculum subflavum]|uniref:ABC transporter substrate-binding protein n=1 Tax=Desertibaculum subflavum TaxID=2268458 RepID=UPI000E66D07F
MSYGKFVGLTAGALMALGAGLTSVATPAAAESTLRVVMHSDLKILDPIWTTAYIVRNHGYMIYDTLIAYDSKLTPKPQMLEKWDISADKLTYTFTLRDGLLWHDGQPVTAEDCIASIKRWGSRDAMGQKLMGVVDKLEAVDTKSFKLVLKVPYGLVLESLGKPSSNVPFMMPKRVAETPGTEQISDNTGSGPFIFKKDEWKPGDKTVYVKNTKYKPRSEPADMLAGGKVVKVDRVEWVAIPDHQTSMNALINGEIDMIESPQADLLPLVKNDKNIEMFNANVLGNQYVIRFNHLHPPFNNQKIRQAAIAAFSQEPFLQAVFGDPDFYKVCPAMFMCGTPLATDKGGDILIKSDFNKSKALLKEAGYDGTPVVLMHSTDLFVLNNLAPVAKDLLEKGGFKVDMQSMDWQTLVARRAKRDAPNAGGWNAFLTSWVAADILNPVMTAFLNSSCEKALFGWPCDPEMEKLRDNFAMATDDATKKQIAEKVQLRALDYGTYAYLGQWYLPQLMRKDRLSGAVQAPVTVFWNIAKK